MSMSRMSNQYAVKKGKAVLVEKTQQFYERQLRFSFEKIKFGRNTMQ